MGSPRQERWAGLDAGMGFRRGLVPRPPNWEETERFSGAAPGLGVLSRAAPTHAEQEVWITLCLMWHHENPFPPHAAPTLLSPSPDVGSSWDKSLGWVWVPRLGVKASSGKQQKVWR